MTNEQIREVAIANGFKLKEQPNGKMDLNPYVYDFARALIDEHENYVKPDSITDIRNWFKAAKPEPTSKDITTQLGCHYEEISEMDVSIDGETSDNEHLAAYYKGCSVEVSYHELCGVDKKELLDSLCDQIVTATGVAYMMGFDIEGALKEVIRSNNSKMVDGKFEFDDNGKIQKPSTFSEPDLTPFIK